MKSQTKFNTTKLVDLYSKMERPTIAPNASDALKQRFKDNWAGWNDINWQALKEYQSWAAEIRAANPKMVNVEYNTHCEAITPFVDEISDYVKKQMGSNPKNAHLQFFLDEIETHKKEKR